MDLLFAIVLMLKDEEADSYHTSLLDPNECYEEMVNHENEIFYVGNIRMEKYTILNLSDFLMLYGGLEDSKHAKSSWFV